MVVFPLISAVISLACALIIARDALRRPRPDKIAWTIAFAIFAVAAGAEVSGSLAAWTELLARVYYLTGAVLVVGFLALGQLYLLAGSRISTFAPGIALLITAFATAMVFGAPIESDRLASDGWDAIERGPGLIALAVSINTIGTLIIVGGLGYSAWRFWRLRIQRNRMIGCLLIVAGTLTVAAGGTLTRFGQHEYLYIAMSAGVTIIFAGYLQARRPDPVTHAASPSETASVTAPDAPQDEPTPTAAEGGRGSLVPLPTNRIRGRSAGDSPAMEPSAADPGVAFLEERFLPLNDAALNEACRIWSAARQDADHFSRDEARAAWALRLRLSPVAQETFDAHSIPAKRQLAELYHEVLAPGAELEHG